MSEKLHYFAYGSNMSVPRLRARCPSAIPVATAYLNGHDLRFHKESSVDGSAKADAYHTDDPKHGVYGVVFEIPVDERPALDAAEGLGAGYESKQVILQLADGREAVAFLYYATQINPQLQPYDWYKQHVLHGANEAGLPEAYQTEIAGVAAIPDPDEERHMRELSIYTP